MPIQASVSDYMIGKIVVDGETTGFTETYNLNVGSSYTDAKSRMTTIATKRARLLARGLAIRKVTVSRAEISRDGMFASGYTYAPVLIGTEMDNPEYPNNVGVGLLIRFDTGDGKFSNRLIKGVRDSWIVRNRYALAAPTLYGIGGPYLTYSAPAAAVDLLGDYLATVRDLTVLIKKDPGPVVSWTPYTYAEWQLRRVSKHDEGRRVPISTGRQRTMA